MRYLLDTNVVSALMRDPDGALARYVSSIDDTDLCTSIVVASEVRFGLQKRGSRRLARSAEEILGSLEILELKPPVDVIYARIRVELERAGTPIGANDLFIAAQAVAQDLILVTDNVREFSRVDSLKVENWLRPDEPG